MRKRESLPECVVLFVILSLFELLGCYANKRT
jgi:hypothetical protein